jgi:hypothetical protein
MNISGVKDGDVAINISGVKYGASLDYIVEHPLSNIHVSSDIPEDILKMIFINLQLRFMIGNVDYNGGWIDENGIKQPHRLYGLQDYYLDSRFLTGLTIPLKNTDFKLYPYLGIGYRYLYNDMRYNDHLYGYQRVSQYLYVPLGMNARYRYDKDWAFSFNAEYDLFCSGKQTSAASGYVLNYNQNKGYGLRFSSRAAREVKNVTLFVEPFLRYWHIACSEIVDKGCEPKNYTREFGVQLGVQF